MSGAARWGALDPHDSAGLSIRDQGQRATMQGPVAASLRLSQPRLGCRQGAGRIVDKLGEALFISFALCDAGREGRRRQRLRIRLWHRFGRGRCAQPQASGADSQDANGQGANG